jgi:hypothetical protein
MLKEKDVTLGLTYVLSDAEREMEASALVETIGKENIYVGLNDVIEAFGRRTEKSTQLDARSN